MRAYNIETLSRICMVLPQMSRSRHRASFRLPRRLCRWAAAAPAVNPARTKWSAVSVFAVAIRAYDNIVYPWKEHVKAAKQHSGC
jgi:hypothetical protein